MKKISLKFTIQCVGGFRIRVEVLEVLAGRDFSEGHNNLMGVKKKKGTAAERTERIKANIYNPVRSLHLVLYEISIILRNYVRIVC